MIIPKEVKLVLEKLKKKNFQVYVVGGCVRDFLQEIEPEDWDVATSAKPEEIQKIFSNSFYKNKFLTVTVKTGSSNPKIKEIEVTTFRLEAKYTDKRHPDEIKFAKTIQEDLSRRDFTINAIAVAPTQKGAKLLTKELSSLNIVDPFDGQKDLGAKIIRTVGKPEDRFSEDALRMIRAVRLAITLNFKIEQNTAVAIEKNSHLLAAISKERIRDELIKIVMSDKAQEGIELLRQTGLLKYIMPELEQGYGISQNKHHVYECYEHALLSLGYAAKKGFNQHVRLASLLHDIAKPYVKKGQGENATFYNHEVVGAKMTIQILNRLRFPKKDIEKIAKLVRFHLFYYNVDEVTESSVRRLVRQVGPEDMTGLLQVRMADRIGSGVPKAEPYKLRHLKYVIEKVSQDPISAKMLIVTGNDIMSRLKIKPGPKIGYILDILLGYVLDDPKKNEKEKLIKEIVTLGKLSDKKLLEMSQKAKENRDIIATKQDQMTKQKYWVS